MNQETPCLDCEKAAKHSYSDETTAGFFYDKCEKHRAAPEQPVSAAPRPQFEYLLNAMENAAQSDNPYKAGYGEKRRAVLDYAASLRHEIAALKEDRDSWRRVAERLENEKQAK